MPSIGFTPPGAAAFRSTTSSRSFTCGAGTPGRCRVDASILSSQPLLLDDVPTRIAHPAWGVDCRMQDGRWHIRWRPLHTPSGIDCRIEHLAATRDVFRTSHEGTREWSPFNYE